MLGLRFSLAALSSLAWDYPPKAGSSTSPAWTPARPPSVRHPHSFSGLALRRPRIFTVASLLACDYPFPHAATPCLHVHLGPLSRLQSTQSGSLPCLFAPSQTSTHFCLGISFFAFSSASAASANWRPTLSQFGPKPQPLGVVPPSMLPL